MRSKLHRPGTSILALWLLVALFATLSPAAGSSEDLFSPDPGFTALAPASGPSEAGRLALPRLVDAALLASGIEPDRMAAYESRVNSLLAKLRAETGTSADPAALGEAVLAFLHREVFASYETDATTLDLALDAGRYNCVSSALLYMIAARSLGLEVIGIKTPDHAFCVLVVPAAAGGARREIDIETTNRYGFDPGNKKEFTDSFGRVTGYAYTPPGAYARREKIEDRSFVGLILSNRASLLERRGRYREALRLGLDLDALAPGPESRNFLLDRVNNVAADLSRRRAFAGATAFAQAAVAAFGEVPRLVELHRSAALNEATALAGAGRWEEALDTAGALIAGTGPAKADGAGRELGSLVEACVGSLAGAKIAASDFAGARAVLSARQGLLEQAAGSAAVSALALRINEAELADVAMRLPFREALAAANKALAEGSVSRARWDELAAYLYGTEANRLAATGDYLGAAAIAEEGAGTVPAKAGALKRFAADVRRAFVAKAHNNFARLYNARDYGGALRVIQEALALLPGDPTLAADLEAARKAAGAIP